MAPHLALVDRALMEMVTGRDKRHLMVFMPPRHGKSELISAHFPAWFLGCHPDKRVMLAGYGGRFAGKWGGRVRDLLEKHGQQYFGVSVSQDSRAREYWDLAGRRGGMMAAGMGGPFTGEGGDVLIVDDPVKNAEEAISPVYRQKNQDWWESTAHPRLEPDGKVALMMTRWHANDLAGWQLEKNPDRWRVISFPALAEHEDVLGRKPGDPLWPDRFGREVLEDVRKDKSSYWWGAMYQQHPATYGEVCWPDDYFVDLLTDEWPRSFRASAIAIDPSKGKDARKADFSAMVFAGICKGSIWLDARLNRIPAPTIVSYGLDWWQEKHPDIFVVEINQFQELLADEFQRQALERGYMSFAVTPVENAINKELRIERLTPWLSRHEVKIRNNQGGRELFRQLREFPQCDHDDGPDATEMALRTLDEALIGAMA